MKIDFVIWLRSISTSQMHRRFFVAAASDWHSRLLREFSLWLPPGILAIRRDSERFVVPIFRLVWMHQKWPTLPSSSSDSLNTRKWTKLALEWHQWTTHSNQMRHIRLGIPVHCSVTVGMSSFDSKIRKSMWMDIRCPNRDANRTMPYVPSRIPNPNKHSPNLKRHQFNSFCFTST